MIHLPIGQREYDVTASSRARHRFSLLTLGVLFVLLGWGGFVTSIDAGMAVPDWPTSFNSWNPFMPLPQWWESIPVLAEHGHRLLGALIGLLTMVLSVWTWRSDPRKWMHKLGFLALGLVVFQGLLGGLRVVLNSPALAMTHAVTAQVFLAAIVALAVFTAPAWLTVARMPEARSDTETLKMAAVAVPFLLLLQIALGALVRHGQQPEGGVIAPPDPLLTGLHIVGGTAAVALIIYLFLLLRKHFKQHPILWRGSIALHGLVVLQFVLGITAYFILLAEHGQIRSTAQVVINTGHLLIGAGLMALAVSLALWTLRIPAWNRQPVAAAPQRP